MILQIFDFRHAITFFNHISNVNYMRTSHFQHVVDAVENHLTDKKFPIIKLIASNEMN